MIKIIDIDYKYNYVAPIYSGSSDYYLYYDNIGGPGNGNSTFIDYS